ncbi:MAG TPA: SPW repeat protein [Acidiferrobacterales bacterium]|nr:SPW repeat protein [Acidiferrobacterales bacterium]
MKGQRWQDSVNLVLGAWLFLSPVLGIGETNDLGAWSSYISGATIALVAGFVLSGREMWEEPINLLIVFWLILAPFVLGFQTGTAWNHVIVGILVGGDTGWAMLQKSPRYRKKGYR